MSTEASTLLDDLSLTLPGPASVDLPPVPPSSKRLFLVRHGQVINPGGDRPVFYGCMDVSLSPFGKWEAKAAGAYLKQFELQCVASSPLSRAKFGANQVLIRQGQGQEEEGEQNTAAGANKEIQVFDGFTEMDRGDWCGKSKDDIGADNLARFNACDPEATPLNGESYDDLVSRVLAARDELLDSIDGGCMAAVVSHLQVTRCILGDALGVRLEELSGLGIATASVTVIDYDYGTSADAGTGGKVEQTVHFQNFKPDAGSRKRVHS